MSTDREIPAEDPVDHIETDREELRVEVRPTDSRTPTYAAWLLGRLCNEMRFRCEIAWLLHNDSDPNRTTETWVAMSALVQEIFPSREAASDALFFVDRAMGAWEQSFTSEWHAEAITGARQLLRNVRVNGGDLPSNQSEVEYLANVASSVTRTFDSLYSELVSSLPQLAAEACSLGYIADQLIHPPFHQRAVGFRPHSAVIEVSRGNGRRRRNRWRMFPEVEQPVDLRLPRQEPERWPDSQWRLQIQFALGNFCRESGVDSTMPDSDWQPQTPPGDILDALQAVVTSPTATSTDRLTGVVLTTVGRQYAQTFQLTINQNRRTITGNEQSRSTRLSERRWRLFVHLLNQQSQPVSADWLRQNWQLFSPTHKKEITLPTVYSAISDLNSVLTDCGVKVHMDQGGYVIKEIES